LLEKNAADAVANYVQSGAITQWGRFVLASDLSDPARSAYFTAVLVNGKANLSWGTLYEINTDHFELERAADGRNFQYFATVAAAGTSSVASDYIYTDPLPINGPMFYRYKLRYKNGTVHNSKIVSVTTNGYPNSLMEVYPSPSTGPVNVRFSSFLNQSVTVQVINSYGQVMSQKTVNAVIGINLVTCDISNLPHGIYYIRAINVVRTAYPVLKQ
jgi:hypothetical protein